MDRYSPEGSIIVVDRLDTEAVDGAPYVFSVRGDTTYKLWQSRPVKRLEPYSWNPKNSATFVQREADMRIVGRVKRTVLDHHVHRPG